LPPHLAVACPTLTCRRRRAATAAAAAAATAATAAAVLQPSPALPLCSVLLPPPRSPAITGISTMQLLLERSPQYPRPHLQPSPACPLWSFFYSARRVPPPPSPPFASNSTVLLPLPCSPQFPTPIPTLLQHFHYVASSAPPLAPVPSPPSESFPSIPTELLLVRSHQFPRRLIQPSPVFPLCSFLS
jgi:hypothetical protein